MEGLGAKGWRLFEKNASLEAWVRDAIPVAVRAVTSHQNQQNWLRHKGTWFAGVHCLENDPKGKVGTAPFKGGAIDHVRALCPEVKLDKGQISVCFAGYPQQDQTETDAVFAFRLNRDAAHLDGLHGIGQPKRRFLREFHQFILGVPLGKADPDASPLVVYEGSHEIMREGLKAVLKDIPEEEWQNIDLTESYKALREKVFETCPRIELTAGRGQSYLVHRLAIHGVAPWKSTRSKHRAIVYFRPEIEGKKSAWLDAA